MTEDRNTKNNGTGLSTETERPGAASQTLVKGATILAAAGIVSKIFGAFFRIPLTNMIGAEGQSYYGVAYPVYQLFFAIATAGFPVAISRMVSERIARGDYINAHKSYKLSMKVSALLGAVSFAIMFFGAGAIARAYANPGAEASLKAVSLALLFTPIVASLRGYYQGRQNMKPTAVTEIIEQMVRVIAGLSLAYVFYKTSLEKAAAGATFGASAGIIAALLLMMLIYRADRRSREKLKKSSIRVNESERERLGQLFAYLIPITIGSCIMPIMINIDAAIIVRRLVATGWDHATAKNLYGLISGYVDPIIGLPNVFVDAICISMMPAITTAFTLKKKEELDTHIKTGLKTMMVIAYPCAIGLIVLARPILRMLYLKKLDEADMAVPLLQILAVSIITLAIMRILASSLQGIGKMNLPVINLFIGAVVKVVLTYVLVGIHFFNVNGAGISSVCAYLTAGILNFRALKKYADVKLDIVSIFVRPLIAALIMGAGAAVSYRLIFAATSSNALSTLAAILIAVVIYFVTVFKIKAVTKDEMELIPKGDLIYRIAQKCRIADQ